MRFWRTLGSYLSKQQSGILSAAAVITASSLVSALLGLLRNRLLVGRFFSTPLLQSQLDAYWVAFRLPELAFQLLVIGSLSAAFIPVYTKYRQKNLDEANLVAASMINLVLLVFVLISAVIFVFAEQFNQLITSTNFSHEQVVLAAKLSRVMLLAQFFFGLSNFFTGIIQSNHRFLIPAIAPLAYNVGIIMGIVFLSPVMGIYGPAVGVVLGAFLHLVMQIPLTKQLGYRHQFRIVLANKGVREMLRLIPPRAFAISVNQLELFASVYFATALSSGSLTIINLAQQLMSAPNRVFSVPLGQASLPFLSRKVAEGDTTGFRRTFLSTFHHILFLALPASVLLLILRIPLVRIAYGSSQFPWEATLLTGRAVAILALALFAQGGIHLLIRSFYALHDTVTPFVVSIVSVIINIGLSWMSVFVYRGGVLGLSWALTMSTLVHFSLLLLLVIYRLKVLSLREVFVPVGTMGLASGVMSIFLWVPMRLLDQFVFDTTRTLPLILLTIIASIIGSGVYMGLAKVLGIYEYRAYVDLLRRLTKLPKTLITSEEIIEAPIQSQEIKPM